MKKRNGAWVIVRSQNKTHFLLGKRASMNNFGDWDFFGGRVEPGETPKAGAIREFMEETGQKPKGIKKFFIVITKKRILNVFLITLPIDHEFPDLNKMEHSEAKWFPINSIPAEVNPPTKKIIRCLKMKGIIK